MPASDVIGTEVQNAEGETVAEIVDLVKEQGAEDLYAVLSVGGFLGIGDKKVVVPLEELDVDQQGEIIMANVTEDQLRDMPEYNEEGYESTAGLGEQPAEQQQQGDAISARARVRARFRGAPLPAGPFSHRGVTSVYRWRECSQGTRCSVAPVSRAS